MKKEWNIGHNRSRIFLCVLIWSLLITISGCGKVHSPGDIIIQKVAPIYLNGNGRKTFDDAAQAREFLSGLSKPIITAPGIRIKSIEPVIIDYIVNVSHIYSYLEFEVTIKIPESARLGDYTYRATYYSMDYPVLEIAGIVEVVDAEKRKQVRNRNKWIAIVVLIVFAICIVIAEPGILILVVILIIIGLIVRVCKFLF